MRELSKDQQFRLVERVFLRLQAYYGTKFNDLWHGINVEEIKRVWAEELGGFSAEQIHEGLRVCLSEKYPPNLPTFLEYCRIKPVEIVRQIEDRTVMDKEKARQLISSLKKKLVAA